MNLFKKFLVTLVIIVMLFNGLSSDAYASEASYTKSDLRMLSCLIYAEAGNQPYAGKLAVANVVLNRLKSKAFSHVHTIREVIYDRKWSVQFAVTIKSRRTGLSPFDKALKLYDTGKYPGRSPAVERKAMKKAIKAAKDALNGSNNIGSYLCFSNKSLSRYVRRHYSNYRIIASQIFYRRR